MAKLEATSREGAPPSGAQLLDSERLERFVADAYWANAQCGTLGALILIRPTRSGAALSPLSIGGALCQLSQLSRQADAVGIVEDEVIALVIRRMDCRDDAYLMMDRIEDAVHIAKKDWEVQMGVTVFPLCGPAPSDAWAAARRDLEGAMSEPHWEHEIPRATLRTICR